MSEQCKAMVMKPGMWRRYPCSRDATKDGYCKQHHPDTIAAKKKRQEEKWDAEYKAARKDFALIDAARDPDNVIITRAELQGLVTLADLKGLSPYGREAKLVERMEAKLKESLEQ